MPTLYPGAVIEPRVVPYASLFQIRTDVQKELDRRAWLYLREIGYDMYAEKTMFVQIVKRNKLDIVRIEATFEQFHEIQTVELETPLKQFETLVPNDKEKV